MELGHGGQSLPISFMIVHCKKIHSCSSDQCRMRTLLLLSIAFFYMAIARPTNPRSNILNVSKEPPSPVGFWPISNSLHDSVYQANRRYATLKGASIGTPGIYNSVYGFISVKDNNSVDIQNVGGYLDGNDAMTWLFYIRMPVKQDATLLQYAGTSQHPGFTFSVCRSTPVLTFHSSYLTKNYTFQSTLNLPLNKWIFMGFTFNKMWTNNDHIDFLVFSASPPLTSTVGMGKVEVSVDAVGDVRIGKSWDDSMPFTGDITCIQFYETSLLGITLEDTFDLCNSNLNTLPGDHTIDATNTSVETMCPSQCFVSDWTSWGKCSTMCAGGTRKRKRTVCCPEMNSTACLSGPCDGTVLLERSSCNEICYNNGFYSGTCICAPGWNGKCCENFVVCDKPEIPSNSRVVVQDYYYSNLSAVVCDIGYAVSSGDAIRVCNNSGMWNGTKPICTLADWKYDPNGGYGEFSYLLLDHTSLSKQRRLLYSVYESRMSKRIIGTCGVVVLLLCGVCIIFMDWMKYCVEKKKSKAQK